MVLGKISRRPYICRAVGRFALPVLALAAATSTAQEWTRFRGPNGTGIGHAPDLTAKISEANIHWKLALPGEGHSSPVLWGDRLFLICSSGDAGGISVLCINAKEGSINWKRDFALKHFQIHEYSSFASCTPAVDAERLYVVWNEPNHYMLTALDHAGKTVWQRDFGPFVSQHGSGTSPVLCDDKVVLCNFQDDPEFVEGPMPDTRTGKSSILAVDARTGKTVWETPRRSTVVAYSTPCIFEPKTGPRALIFNSQSHGISALDPGTGKVLSEYGQAFKRRSISSPIIAGDLVLGSCGSGAGGNVLAAIRPPTTPDAKEPALAYQLKKSAPYVPTGICQDNLIWLWSDAGIVTCLTAATGDVRYQERVGGNFFGSPVLADGRLYCVSAEGELVAVRASDKFNVLGRYDLNETCRSTPAVALGCLFVRCERHLWCFGAARPAP
jgi:outer membrane protein assembly factor BamB